jgi:hypothetical protein
MATNVRKQHPQAPGIGVVQRVESLSPIADGLWIVVMDHLVEAQAWVV